MKMHTVKQLSRLSGVSVRTLHYYDQIALLRPARVGANGYRYYGRDELLRLQQILLHRELGLPLDAIAALLHERDDGRAARLRQHRERLVERIDRYRELVATLDHTIEALEGTTTMDVSKLYAGFSAEKQAEHERWLVDRGGECMRQGIETSRRHVRELGDAGLQQRMTDLASLESELASHCRSGTAHHDPRLHAALERHRAWVASMWNRPCSPDAYAGLADLYEAHPDFRTRYETLAPGLSDYLPTAMRAYSRMVST